MIDTDHEKTKREMEKLYGNKAMKVHSGFSEKKRNHSRMAKKYQKSIFFGLCTKLAQMVLRLQQLEIVCSFSVQLWYVFFYGDLEYKSNRTTVEIIRLT